MNTQGKQISTSRKLALAGAGVVTMAALVFVFQNSESVAVQWLGFTIQAPLFVIMILSGLTAVGLRDLVAWGLRRRARVHARQQSERGRTTQKGQTND